jgi:hypothetical protein
MYTITTGMNGGVSYHGFPPPMYGAWNQFFHGSYPHYYHIGKTKYHIKPRPHGTPYSFPYLGPSVPFGFH